MVKTTLTRGGFSAELYFDRKSDPPIYHYVITATGSAEILAWGQVWSRDEAKVQAIEAMDQLSRGLRKSAGSGLK